MRSSAGTARGGHAGRIYVAARGHEPIRHGFRPQHLQLHGIRRRMGIAANLTLRIPPADNIHVDRHSPHAGESRHAQLLIGTIAAALPMTRRRNDKRMPFTARRRIDGTADIKPRQGFERIILGCIAVVTDFPSQPHVGLRNKPPDERFERQRLFRVGEQNIPAPLPLLPVGILRRKPRQQFRAVGRSAAIIFVGLDRNLPVAAPHQVERVQQVVERLAERIGAPTPIGKGHPHRVGRKLLAANPHTELRLSTAQHLRQRPPLRRGPHRGRYDRRLRRDYHRIGALHRTFRHRHQLLRPQGQNHPHRR